MVQSNYTVSSAEQLLGRMPSTRPSGSKSKSKSASKSSSTAPPNKPADQSSRAPPPRPTPHLWPPTPAQTVRLRASCSSGVLAVTDKVKIKTDFPAVAEEEVAILPATVYTQTTPTATTLPATVYKQTAPTATTLSATVYKPTTLKASAALAPPTQAPAQGLVIETGDSKKLEPRISQYYEYITPPISLGLGRSESRRERKASHTPTSSGGSVDIYFSPIDATRSQVFLSSPQPSPPISPSDLPKADTLKSKQAGVVDKLKNLAFDDKPAKMPTKMPEMAEIAGIGRIIDKRKVTLTLADVDRLTTRLATAPLVQMRVRESHLDTLPENMSATASSSTTSEQTHPTNHKTIPTKPPTPPPSEASTSNETGGIALLNHSITGTPATHTSSAAFSLGACTHLSLPYGLSTTSTLRIEAPTPSTPESKIILQTLFAALNRKTGAHETTLLAETDVTTSFACAALTELAATQNLTLDDIEVRTPTDATSLSPEESIDWCRIDEDNPASSPTTDLVNETLALFASTKLLTAETCAMQTLTLLSELARLKTAHATFMVLQPTKFDLRGELVAVKIPLVSGALKARFAKMGAASGAPGGESVNGGSKGRLLREAVIAAVAPGLVAEEEFETFVEVENGRVKVRVRCVPLVGGDGVERWVCFLGGEYDVAY